MRYRKSIKICKGVKVNFSKSGTSLTLGGKGASVNIGKKGTYLNTGIPGTGFYSRQRIDGGAKKSGGANKPTTTVRQHFQLHYNDDASVSVIDSSGNLVTDKNILRQIKASNEYKTEIERLSQLRIDSLNEETEAFVSIYKQSAKVYANSVYRKKLETLKPERYEKKEFTQTQPSVESVRAFLEEEANRNISTMKFWKKKELIENYIQENLRKELADQLVLWKKEKDAFEENEEKKEKELNEAYEKEYKLQVESLSKLLDNDAEEVGGVIDEWISTVEFPFEFSLDYDIRNNELLIDLDLPEIEDMPIYCAQRMANGTVKVKNKTQKETKEDYYKCVLGLALFFATHLMNCAIGAEVVTISAYTQRRDSKGLMNDEYIYSIKFDRENLLNVDLSKEVETIVFKFENICLPKADKTFKKIEPFA